MPKRYYKKGEKVWVIDLMETASVAKVDVENKEVVIETKDGRELVRKFWNIDKYKPRPQREKLFFAKVNEGAIIPQKEDEDAGYDFYANIEPNNTELEGEVYEQYLTKGKVNVVKTGIASSVSEDYFLSLKSERSSVAKYGLNVSAGVIDSGYRGEIMLMVTPLVKDILITSTVDKVEEMDNVVLYPYSKAIAQAVLLPVPKVDVQEVSYEELLSMPSRRGTGGWGSSGK